MYVRAAPVAVAFCRKPPTVISWLLVTALAVKANASGAAVRVDQSLLTPSKTLTPLV